MKLSVYYRVNPRVSKNPVVHPDDKLRLSELALRSFVDGLGCLDSSVTVIYDSCPPGYYKLFKRYLPDHQTLLLEGAGNRGSWERQLELIKHEHNGLVYLAEDDYYYKPGALESLADFIQGTRADFATPYDHPDYYRLPFHSGRYEIKYYNGQYYRTAGTTTNTFMARRRTLLRVMPTLQTYSRGNSDAGYWMSLTGHNLLSRYSHWSWRHAHWPQVLRTLVDGSYKLWCPVPGTATHLESSCIAPGMESIQ